jgi:DNA-binding NtrC family response regulator
LLEHRYQTNVRELELLLREAFFGNGLPASATHASTSRTRPRAVEEARGVSLEGDKEPVDTASITAEQIRAALEQHRGVQERVWKTLGLSSRFALGRLMRKYGIKP